MPRTKKIEQPRNPDGNINNCALANGEIETSCQMCLRKCPDRKRLHPARLGEDGFPNIVPATESAAVILAGRKSNAAARTIPLPTKDQRLFEPAPGAPDPTEHVLDSLVTDRRRSVEARDVPARLLLTIEPDAQEWSPTIALCGEAWKGALVRLRPPPRLRDSDVEEVAEKCRRAGAERVVVLPRSKPSVVPAKVADSSERKRTTARQAIMELVEESNSKSVEALRAFADLVMSRCGL